MLKRVDIHIDIMSNGAIALSYEGNSPRTHEIGTRIVQALSEDHAIISFIRDTE